MITESIKKYTLTEEEISAIKTTFEIVNELRYEEFDIYGDFYGSGLSFEDTRGILKLILENNDKNLEQGYSLFFFIYPNICSARPGGRYARLRGNITKKNY